MQTCFMHPPFGFALFYLRGIAPKSIKTSDIYWGAIPWVVLQLILVAILIAFPEIVTYFLDPAKIKDFDGNFTLPGTDGIVSHAAGIRSQHGAKVRLTTTRSQALAVNLPTR